MTPVSGTAQWLTSEDGPVYSVLHAAPESAARSSTAVLMVPPFGVDEVFSHRARRYWAIRLAQAGHTTLRLDLPGTGESYGGPRLPDLMGRWTQAVDQSARWLLARSEVSRLALIAVGLGGLIACRAVAEGTPVDDLVLWAVKAKGRAAVRELVAFARVAASEYPEDQDGPQPADGEDIIGFLLARETSEALSATDVTRMVFPPRVGRRALLLGRDDLGIDPHLQEALTAQGVSVQTRQTDDFGSLMAHPQDTDLRRPEATIALCTEWLATAGPTGPDAPAPAPEPPWVVSQTAHLQHGDALIRETIFNVSVGGAAATMVISEPDANGPRAGITALLLNAGTIRKMGADRMEVELARRWAARGVPTIRADYGPVGDSASVNDEGLDERPLVTPPALASAAMIDGAKEVLALAAQQIPVTRVVAVGDCSGAYIGLRLAVEHPDIVACFGVNLSAFAWDEGLHQERMFDRIVTAARGGIVRRLREQGLSAHELRQVVAAVRHRYLHGRSEPMELGQRKEGEKALDILRDRETAVLMLFSQDGDLHAELFADGFQAEVSQDRWPNASIEELPTRDHMAHAIWLQQLRHDRLDRALEDVLARLPGAHVTPGRSEVTAAGDVG